MIKTSLASNLKRIIAILSASILLGGCAYNAVNEEPQMPEDKKLVIYGIGDSNWGEKLGEFTYESGAELNEAKEYTERSSRYEEEFKLDNGKIYKVVTEEKRPNNTNYVALYSFYCCPIDKILKGDGSWELAFTNEWTD